MCLLFNFSYVFLMCLIDVLSWVMVLVCLFMLFSGGLGVLMWFWFDFRDFVFLFMFVIWCFHLFWWFLCLCFFVYLRFLGFVLPTNFGDLGVSVLFGYFVLP